MNKFYIYPGNYSGIIRDGLLRRGNWVEEDKSVAWTNCHFIWKPTNLSVEGYNKLDGIVRNRSKNFVQVFNHFENIRGICTKTGLIRSLKKYYQRNKEAERCEYTVFDSTPTSFVITAGVNDHEHAQFLTRFREIEKQNFTRERLPSKHCVENFWLVKPANLNQGKGIHIFKSLKDIHSFLDEKEQHSFWVIQKYLEKPMLYHGRKFDIRVWCTVTHKNEIFVYKKAYIRTSSDSYDLNNKNNYVHLTNNCLQQFGDNYGKHEDGNTLPLECLDPYFETLFPGKNIKLDTHIIPRIKDLIIDTMLCTKNDLNPKHRPNIFEFFGFDFMIDEDLRTWLIEINTNPYLGTPNEYIGKLLPNMVDDMLEITTDHLLPPKNNVKKDRVNDFELIFCEGNSRHHDGPFNARSSFLSNIYPSQELTPPDAAKRLEAAEKRQKQQLAQSRSLQSTTVKFVSPESHANKAGYASPQLKNQSNVATAEKVNQAAGNNKEEVEKKELEKEFLEREVLMESTEDSGDDGEAPLKQSAVVQSAEDKLKWSKSHKNTIEIIFKNMHLASIYKTTPNAAAMSKELNIVLSCLKNWELISEKRSNITCKTLKLIAQSSGSFLLTEPHAVKTLADLLKSANVSIDIKLAIVETVSYIAKDFALKKKLINTKLVHELVRICVSSCDEKEIQNYSKQLLVTALKCLLSFGATFFKKASSVAEAKDFERVRSSYMAQGALIAVWLVANHSIDLDMKEMAFRTFLINVDYKSMEKQLHILEILKIIPEASENEDSDIDEAQRNLQNSPEAKDKGDTVQDEIIEENKQKECDTSTINYQKFFHTEGDASPMKNDLNGGDVKDLSFPKSLLKIYSLEKLQYEFREFLKCLKDVQYNKENEDKDKRTMFEHEKQRKDDQRRQQVVEDAKRLHIPKIEKRSKSKLKLQQLQNMYLQKTRTDFAKAKDTPEKIAQTLQGQLYKRRASAENKRRDLGEVKFIEDLMEKSEHENNFMAVKPNATTHDGFKKDRTPSVKDKAREMKSYRIMSKTNAISTPSLRYKNSLVASMSSAPLCQSRDMNSDGENTNNTTGVKSQTPLKVKDLEKKFRSSVEQDLVKNAELEQIYGQDSAEKIAKKVSQKQLRPLTISQVDGETKDIETTSRMRKTQQQQVPKRKNVTPGLPKRAAL